MNGNLSLAQSSSMTNSGAMPIKNNFDGPAPIKEDLQKAVDAPNQGIHIPKPGFF